MERNQVISVAVGVGALGTALAYLAYSHINKNENNELIDNLVEKNENQINQEENIKLETKKIFPVGVNFGKMNIINKKIMLKIIKMKIAVMKIIRKMIKIY